MLVIFSTLMRISIAPRVLKSVVTICLREYIPVSLVTWLSIPKGADYHMFRRYQALT